MPLNIKPGFLPSVVKFVGTYLNINCQIQNLQAALDKKEKKKKESWCKKDTTNLLFVYFWLRFQLSVEKADNKKNFWSKQQRVV